jgi:uncharacterized protein (TIGR02145 family)
MSLLISFTAVYFYSPVIKSHAEESQTLDFNVNVDPELSLTTSSEDVNMEARINSFTHSSIDLTVKTNSLYGFTLSIEDADNNTNMVHENPNVSEVFTSSFEGQKTSATLDNGTWGYSLDGGENYISMPVYGSPRLIDQKVKRQTSLVTNTVDFGAKVGNATSGTYSDTVLFTAYTNGADGLPEDGTEVEGAKSTVKRMQGDFVCDELEIGERAYVIDIRDKNKYSVMRLKDGNCWMLENLRITNKVLTPEDSNVASNFTLKASDPNDFVYDEEEEELQLYNKNGVYYDSRYGAYYTWYTATAGTVLDASSLELDEYHNAEYSICPKGWRLPSVANTLYLVSLYSNGEDLYSTYVPINNGKYTGGIYPSSEFSFSEIDEYFNAWSSTYMAKIATDSYSIVASGEEYIATYAYYSEPEEYNGDIFEELTSDWDTGSFNGFSVHCMSGSVNPPDSLYSYLLPE